MKESLMNRFDALDVRVRQLLQTCAVLGKAFALSDLICVHPELEETEIEVSLDVATKEMILIEVMDDEEERTVYSQSTGCEQSTLSASIEYTKTSSGFNIVGDRYFQFSHDVSFWMFCCSPWACLRYYLQTERYPGLCVSKFRGFYFDTTDVAVKCIDNNAQSEEDGTTSRHCRGTGARPECHLGAQ